jgi:hypothetical protein
LSSSSVSTSTPPSSAASSPVEQNVNLNDTIENLAFSLLNKLTLQSIGETVVESCGSKPQLIIDDVLLMSRKDGRPVVPLAEQEQSFNSIEQVKIEDDNERLDEVVEPVVDVVVEDSAFMMLINKIVPNSHMIEHRFEYEVCKVDDDDDVCDVKLTGSFNNWQQFLPMSRDPTLKTKWFKNLMLAPGEYEYKFVINDCDWRCNTLMPFNGLNNVVNLVKN